MIKYFYIIYSFFFHLLSSIKLKVNIIISVKKIKKIKINENKLKNNNKIIIFGSSKTLLELKGTEKKILNKFPKVFMNRNLIYWKILNIWPEYYFLLDTPMKSKVSNLIFIETLKIIKKNEEKNIPTLLLENFYKLSTPKNYKAYFYNFKKSSNLNWANNDKEVLFGHHGSLTSLINILSLLNYKKILILGVDLNITDYFFNTTNKSDCKFLDKESHIMEEKFKIHSNLIKKNNKNILSHWNLINKNLKKRNIQIFCGSKKSEFVKKNLLRYLSINNFLKL